MSDTDHDAAPLTAKELDKIDAHFQEECDLQSCAVDAQHLRRLVAMARRGMALEHAAWRWSVHRTARGHPVLCDECPRYEADVLQQTRAAHRQEVTPNATH